MTQENHTKGVQHFALKFTIIAGRKAGERLRSHCFELNECVRNSCDFRSVLPSFRIVCRMFQHPNLLYSLAVIANHSLLVKDVSLALRRFATRVPETHRNGTIPGDLALRSSRSNRVHIDSLLPSLFVLANGGAAGVSLGSSSNDKSYSVFARSGFDVMLNDRYDLCVVFGNLQVKIGEGCRTGQ